MSRQYDAYCPRGYSENHLGISDASEQLTGIRLARPNEDKVEPDSASPPSLILLLYATPFVVLKIIFYATNVA